LGDIGKVPYLLCFSKNQMSIIGGNSLEPLQVYEASYFEENNIGNTMYSNNKVVFVPRQNSLRNLE